MPEAGKALTLNGSVLFTLCGNFDQINMVRLHKSLLDKECGKLHAYLKHSLWSSQPFGVKFIFATPRRRNFCGVRMHAKRGGGGGASILLLKYKAWLSSYSYTWTI